MFIIIFANLRRKKGEPHCMDRKLFGFVLGISEFFTANESQVRAREQTGGSGTSNSRQGTGQRRTSLGASTHTHTIMLLKGLDKLCGLGSARWAFRPDGTIFLWNMSSYF